MLQKVGSPQDPERPSRFRGAGWVDNETMRLGLKTRRRSQSRAAYSTPITTGEVGAVSHRHSALPNLRGRGRRRVRGRIWDLRQTAAHRFQQRLDRLDRLIPHIRDPETLPLDLPVTAIDLEAEFIP